MKIYLDQSPTSGGHAHRGIGAYTRNLVTALLDERIELVENPHEADIIHYPFFDLFKPTLPFKYLLPFSPFKKPVVITIHDVIPLLFPKHYPVGKKGTVAHWYQKQMVSFAAHIITDSESSKQDIHTYLHVPLHKITCVYLAAAQQSVTVSKDEIKKTLQFYNLTQPYILYVGDINYNKNLPALISALKYLPEHVHLVCIGKNFREQPIPEWQAIKQGAAGVSKHSTNTNRIHFLSNISNNKANDIAALYAGAAVYVQPSLSEGFGLPVLEAMQFGTPVVATQSGSLPEVVGEHGVLTHVDAQSLAKGIQKVLDYSQSQRTQVVSAAKKWTATFTWNKAAQQTIAVYRSILEGDNAE